MVTATPFQKESSISEKSSKAQEMTEAEVVEEPSFSDPEDFVDDINDSDLLEDVQRQKPNEEECIDCVVVVDCIPKVGQDKLPKLKTVLNNVFNRVGKIASDYYPMAPNPENPSEMMTKGYCFLEFMSKSSAQDAIYSLNEYKLDKNHTFVVTMIKDYEKFKKYNTEVKWEEPKRKPYKDRGNLLSWLLNADCMDQFVLQSEGGDRIAVYQNAMPEPHLVTEKLHWSDTFVRWSPFGKYLASVHRQGIAVWGGEKFEQIQKFDHPNASYLDFSPCENYIVTYAPPKSRYTDATDAIKIWTVRTGELKQSFSGANNVVKKWPHFKWSFDDKYFACMTKDETLELLNIYETTTFNLVDKKPVKVDGIRDLSWSPSEHILAYWVAEKDQTPGRVAIMKVPEKCDLRSKNMFNLADASIHWQKSGENLCFKVDRYAKKKEEKEGEIKYSHISIQLEIFHMKVKEYPVSMQEVKETVQGFAFEPVGSKFCVIQGDMRTFVAFYNVKSKPVGVSHIKTLEHRVQVNTIFWAPCGQYVVLAGLKTTVSGALMFVDAGATEITVMNQQEHTGVTDVEWDPTGRFVVSSVSSWSTARGGADFGYMLWNFQGRLLARRPVNQFCTLSWRPRPPSLLNEAKGKEVKKNMKKYAAEFDEKDKRRQDKASQEVAEKRQAQIAEYKIWRDEQRARYMDEKSMRKQLREGEDTDEIGGVEGDVEEETIEYMISQEETPAE